MANFTRAGLKTETGNLIPDNTNEEITPALDREDRGNHADSLVSRLDDPYMKFLGTTGGTSTALTLTSSTDYPASAYDSSMPFIFRMGTASGASPTININSIGAINLYDDQQNQITAAGDLGNGRLYAGIYSADADGAGTQGIVIILRFGTEISTIVTRSNAGTLTLTEPGKYVFYGTTSTWTLPAGSTSVEGKDFTFANTGSGNLTIQGAGSDTIANSDPFILYPGTNYQAFWDGTTWIFI